MDVALVTQQLALSLGLGMLVGLQRERSSSPLAGLRTFPLVTMLGTLAALLAGSFGGWIVGFGFLAVTGVVVMGNFLELHVDKPDPGLTTEVAMLVMYALGAFVTLAPMPLAIALGAGVAVLLHLKAELHSVAGRLGEKDFKAIMQFVLITLVILPILPRQNMGPYNVFNPFNIWLMVVLIVGISLAGYVAFKWFGSRAGTFAGGILGGLISSTATTLSYARRSREMPDSSRVGAGVIMIASAVVFVRVLVEVSAISPALLGKAVGPVGVLLTTLGCMALRLIYRNASEHTELREPDNPSELKPAILFGALYALVLFAVAAAKDWLGLSGIYGVAVLSGLTDMDAITLSVSQLVKDGTLEPQIAWRVIVVASMANLVFKTGVVAYAGSSKLRNLVAGHFTIAILVGLALVFFWPA